MARFTAAAVVGAPAPAVWAVLTDWRRHGDWAPLTRVWLTTPRGDEVGARFVGRTGIGPVAFDDPMEVVAWQPPTEDRAGRCELAKQGRVVLGRAVIEAVPLRGGRTRVAWTEDVELAPVRLSAPLAPLVSAGGQLAFGLVLRRMRAEVEARPSGSGRA